MLKENEAEEKNGGKKIPSGGRYSAISDIYGEKCQYRLPTPPPSFSRVTHKKRWGGGGTEKKRQPKTGFGNLEVAPFLWWLFWLL